MYETMSDELEVRIAKARQLQAAGHDPYHPACFQRDHFVDEVRQRYCHLASDAQLHDRVSLAGRVVAVRDMGKTLFVDIKDQTGKIQTYNTVDVLGEQRYSLLRECLDQGDWLGVWGRPFTTKRGELSIEVTDYRFLTKSIRPLPYGKETATERFHKVEDAEILYRQPEIGMATDSCLFETLKKRARLIRTLRERLWELGFDETDIPVLETVYGGASARPFITTINALDQLPVYLRISLELPLKRLIVGGFDGVFHIGHVFRNEGMDRNHSPEFTLLEVYKALWDYHDVMRLTEDLITTATQNVNDTLAVTYGTRTIDLSLPWKRVTLSDAIKEYANIDVEQMDDLQLRACAARHNSDILERANIAPDLADGTLVERVLAYNATLPTLEGRIPLDTARGNIIAYLFEELVASQIIQPTFVIDHPKETSPLCKPHRSSPELIERFELFINGWEFANAYSELNDPVLQRKLLEEQAQQLRAGREEAMPMDEYFVRAIEYGMPTTGGLGIGIDRLVMLLTAHHWPPERPPTIRDVLFFPLMKPQ